MKSTKNKKLGFSLLEVLVALFVLIVGLLAVIQLYPTGLNVARLSKNETKATNLMQKELEVYQNAAFDDIQSSAKEKVSEDPESPYYNFESETQVNFVDSSLNITEVDTGLKKIKVIIYWIEQGQEDSVDGTFIKKR